MVVAMSVTPVTCNTAMCVTRVLQTGLPQADKTVVLGATVFTVDFAVATIPQAVSTW